MARAGGRDRACNYESKDKGPDSGTSAPMVKLIDSRMHVTYIVTFFSTEG
jgi:hypothetical protein